MPTTYSASVTQQFTYVCNQCGNSWTGPITAQGDSGWSRNDAQAVAMTNMPAMVANAHLGSRNICPRCCAMSTLFMQRHAPQGIRALMVSVVPRNGIFGTIAWSFSTGNMLCAVIVGWFFWLFFSWVVFVATGTGTKAYVCVCYLPAIVLAIMTVVGLIRAGRDIKAVSEFLAERISKMTESEAERAFGEATKSIGLEHVSTPISVRGVIFHIIELEKWKPAAKRAGRLGPV